MSSYASLASVRHRIKLGAPVPFNIRSEDKTLLLARGQVIRDDDQLDALFDRGAVVDSDEVKSPVAEVQDASIEQLPGLWTGSVDRVGRTLRAISAREFAQALEEASQPMLALVERDPDLAIFQMVRQENAGKNAYGVAHSVHTAIASYMVAQRLGWDAVALDRVFKAALTMNLSIVELQGRLATQMTPLTVSQRDTIREHPTRSMEMLQASGVTDQDWLDAVACHHETNDGKGYPKGVSTDIGEIASLIHRTDVYTAKLSARTTRQALPANQAARDLFLQDDKSAMATAVIKEFGVYPPGCYVQLLCGEVGVVIKRGATANTPVVASLTNKNGDALLEPIKRHTETKEFAIVGVVNESTLRVRVSPEKLVVLSNR